MERPGGPPAWSPGGLLDEMRAGSPVWVERLGRPLPSTAVGPTTPLGHRVGRHEGRPFDHRSRLGCEPATAS
jgi:hypothetical protein